MKQSSAADWELDPGEKPHSIWTSWIKSLAQESSRSSGLRGIGLSQIFGPRLDLTLDDCCPGQGEHKVGARSPGPFRHEPVVSRYLDRRYKTTGRGGDGWIQTNASSTASGLGEPYSFWTSWMKGKSLAQEF